MLHFQNLDRVDGGNELRMNIFMNISMHEDFKKDDRKKKACKKTSATLLKKHIIMEDV